MNIYSILTIYLHLDAISLERQYLLTSSDERTDSAWDGIQPLPVGHKVKVLVDRKLLTSTEDSENLT